MNSLMNEHMLRQNQFCNSFFLLGGGFLHASGLQDQSRPQGTCSLPLLFIYLSILDAYIYIYIYVDAWVLGSGSPWLTFP